MEKHITIPGSACLLAVIAVAIPHGTRAQEAPPPPAIPAGITIGPGCTFTIGEGADVTTVGGGVHVMDGGVLRHQGNLVVGGDLVVEGQLRTVIGGDDVAPRHGRIVVRGASEYWGTLAVALARDARFTKARDFILATQSFSDGQLAASQLPGARWSSRHHDEAFVVRLQEAADLPDDFSLAVDGARDGDEVVIDWVAYADERSRAYVIERYYAAGDWRAVEEVMSLGASTRAAYYSTRDTELPDEAQTLRYRVRLVDESGTWRYSDEVLVDLGRSPRLVAFPNPNRPGGRVRLLGADTSREPHRLRLTGTDGRVLLEQELGAGDAYELALPSLITAGVHQVTIDYREGEAQSASVIVVR